jgi:hypothetical protein
MTLISLLPCMFMCPQYSHYLLQEIQTYKILVAFNGITLISNFVNIGHVVQKLKWRTQIHTAGRAHKTHLFP